MFSQYCNLKNLIYPYGKNCRRLDIIRENKKFLVFRIPV